MWAVYPKRVYGQYCKLNGISIFVEVSCLNYFAYFKMHGILCLH